MKIKKLTITMLLISIVVTLLSGCNGYSQFEENGLFMKKTVDAGEYLFICYGFVEGYFEENVVLPARFKNFNSSGDVFIVAPRAFEGELIKELQIFSEAKDGCSIRDKAFYSCTELKKVELSNCLEVHKSAFAYCAEGLEFTIYDLIPPRYAYYLEEVYGPSSWEYEETDWNAFEGIEDFKIFVPAEAVEAYKSALGWRLYADHIFPIAE